MSQRGPRKSPREKDLTGRYFAGNLDEDRIPHLQRFTDRAKHATQNKIVRTALLRAEEPLITDDLDTLPIGQVIQVHSLFSEVEHEGTVYLCVLRKTLMKLADTYLLVGDRVRFRPAGATSEIGLPEAVIEQIFPRATVLTRADSFKQIDQHPIVANADQLLLVAALLQPRIKWGLIDRMLIAASAGGLVPLFVLNKIDLAQASDTARKEYAFAQTALAHYNNLGIRTVQASATEHVHLDTVRDWLKDKTTVLAGHSGVGKSSLINAIQPSLRLRTAPVSGYNDKGRHTTSSARRYVLDFGGHVIDTPGVKLFGLWNLTPDTLIDHFPDVADNTAPDWRRESYQRILDSLT